MVFMGFRSFLYLLVVSVAISLILFFAPKTKVRFPRGYPISLVVGYLGAWLGTPVFGRWEFLTFDGISIIPAILGSVAAILLAKGCMSK